VAWDDDRYRVLAVGGPHRSCCRPAPESPGEGAVAPGAPRPDAAQRLPDLTLERGPAGIDRYAIDRGEVAGQVGADPPADPERIARPHRPRGPVARDHRTERAGASELEGTQATVAGCDHNAPDRAHDLVEENTIVR